MDHSMNKNQPKSFGIPDAIEEQLNAQLILLYGDERAPVVKSQLIAMLGQFAAQHPRLYDGQRGQVTAADAMLITYGDQLPADGMYPLEALQSWLETNMAGKASAACTYCRSIPIHRTMGSPWSITARSIPRSVMVTHRSDQSTVQGHVRRRDQPYFGAERLVPGLS